MSRTSYPIFRKLLFVAITMGISAFQAVAEQVNAKPVTVGFFQSPLFLLIIFSTIICFSIVYRKFMYNRLLASKKNLELPAKTHLKAHGRPIEGILDQVVLDKDQENVKTHIQVVHNLLHLIGLLQQQSPFFQR